MLLSRVSRFSLSTFTIAIFGIAFSIISANSPQSETKKPKDAIKGGIWYDHFYTWELAGKDNVDVQMSHLFLKLEEPLHWTQTWTAHFAGGEFFQTEAISDSVRLAPDGFGQYFATGIYTSTVFDAGKAVDWSAVEWNFTQIPDSLEVQFRTGATPDPDETWMDWMSLVRIPMEYTCVYVWNTNLTECVSNMIGIESSPFIQYRALFNSENPMETVALNDIDLLYGIHPSNGIALSNLIQPADLREWESLLITSTIPLSTTLVFDLLASDGSVLLQDLHTGDSLADIDPLQYPALQLRASFTTDDDSLTPDVDLWGLKWLVLHKQYLPGVIK